jgi:hypothetical protein
LYPLTTQTILDGITVSKMVETVDILSVVLNKDESNMILNNINIKNITD